MQDSFCLGEILSRPSWTGCRIVSHEIGRRYGSEDVAASRIALYLVSLCVVLTGSFRSTRPTMSTTTCTHFATRVPKHVKLRTECRADILHVTCVKSHSFFALQRTFCRPISCTSCFRRFCANQEPPTFEGPG